MAMEPEAVDWRFISLRMLNAGVDYDGHFPAGYEAGHTAGLRLLRVAARTRTEHGRQAVGPLAAKDVGTPVIHFGPPHGTAFFGPVINRLPSDQEAVQLWGHVVGLASFPGFAELKRSLRERPQLRSFGASPGETGIQEDWRGGSRRLKK